MTRVNIDVWNVAKQPGRQVGVWNMGKDINGKMLVGDSWEKNQLRLKISDYKKPRDVFRKRSEKMIPTENRWKRLETGCRALIADVGFTSIMEKGGQLQPRWVVCENDGKSKKAED